jgi:lipopolysaccharide transport system ATP-binding protein
MTTAIHVRNLGKRYQLGAREARYATFRDALVRAAKAPFDRFRRLSGRASVAETFWALQDVSFDIEEGEVVGIIGRNGAGKSTLLKILSQITEPTTGEVELHGRVGSLLEVGTGFHPELTGRENIYLNGAILGMKREEITRRFDEIVAFAGVEKFLDTPVKRYSSGMYVRLAFAVAAHIEPDILIVDEVLAVGDAAFQEKCLGKMGEVARGGRTVLFVSHNMAAVQHLCSRVVMLKAGKLHANGPSADVVCEYLSNAKDGQTLMLDDWQDRETTGDARITKVEIGGKKGGIGMVSVGGEMVIRIHATVNELLEDPQFGVIVHTALGEPLLDLSSLHDGLRLGRVIGKVIVQVRVRDLGLYPGRYYLTPWIADSSNTRNIDSVRLSCMLDVSSAPGVHGDLKLKSMWGKYFVQSYWNAESEA